MSKIYLKKLKQQIEKVIPLLESRREYNPTSLLDYILLHYQEALAVLASDPAALTKEDFAIQGGVRLLLEATGKYEDPMLEEMYVAEKLLEVWGG